MKSGINPISLRGIVMLLLCVATISLFGQAMPRIEARFANPQYDPATRAYFLDVELSSKYSPEMLFGMNLRFFYDASLMTFQQVDQFQPGYGILGEAPKPAIGNQQSGSQLFAFNHAAAYVNGGVQLQDDRFPLQIPVNGWVKAFRLCFKVPSTKINKDQFCPSVIWDLEAEEGAGGFLPGSAGVVITVTENNRSTRFASRPTLPSVVQFNWKYNAQGGLPHGSIVSGDCISLDAQIASDGPMNPNANGYALYQNQPNPFDGMTRIDFVLPSAQHATLVLYDVNGVIKEVVEGNYQAGKNQIELKQKPWMVETSVIYYRLQTDQFTSKAFTMSLVRA